jgi:uncharacterized membrane protein (UPF0127 family)
MRTVKVFNQSKGELICDRVGVANTSMRRLFGLLGRSGLDAGEGLWIKPSSGVHTVGMRFPIDVVGLDRKGTVLKLWNSLAPFRLTSVSIKMHSVIEMRAGQIVESGIRVGDSLQFLDVQPQDASDGDRG